MPDRTENALSARAMSESTMMPHHTLPESTMPRRRAFISSLPPAGVSAMLSAVLPAVLPTALLVALLALPLAAGQAQAADLSGSWHGTWQSCSTGHQGPLRATFCPIGPARYQVDFSGRFFALLPFRYSVMLDVVGQDADAVHLAGSAHLGRLFGTFHYTAVATETDFVAAYHACRDQGQFILHRCCP